MNFLNDKKNLPIIIGVAVVVLILAVGSILYFSGIIGGSGSGGAQTASSTAPGNPSVVSGPGIPPPSDASHMMVGAPGSHGPAPGAPSNTGAPQSGSGQPQTGGPGGPFGQPGPSQVAYSRGHKNNMLIGKARHAAGSHRHSPAAAAPSDGTAPAATEASNPAIGPDPFFVEAPKAATPDSIVNGTGIHHTLPPIVISDPTLTNGGSLNPTLPPLPTQFQDQTPRRVDGILRGSDGVFAVLETNGVSQTVQPGDTVDGAMVLSIDQAGVTMRTEDNHTIHVPLSDTPQVESR